MFYLADSSSAFLSSRPDWTLEAATILGPAGDARRVEQRPFYWADGVWEAEVVVHPHDPAVMLQRTLVRVTPDTLRRWKDVGIDPFVEACAQLRDHLRRARNGELSLLTLL